MNGPRHLDLEWSRYNFKTNPNARSAHWYLQNLLRYCQAEKISPDQLQNGMAEIKAWQKEKGNG